jgi:hypothetical protein
LPLFAGASFGLTWRWHCACLRLGGAVEEIVDARLDAASACRLVA